MIFREKWALSPLRSRIVTESGRLVAERGAASVDEMERIVREHNERLALLRKQEAA